MSAESLASAARRCVGGRQLGCPSGESPAAPLPPDHLMISFFFLYYPASILCPLLLLAHNVSSSVHVQLGPTVVGWLLQR